MTMDPTNKRSESSQGSEFDQDLEAIRAAWPPMEEREPPELLDQAVINTARREHGGRRRPLRWMGAFATASVIILALAIVIQQDPVPPMVTNETDGLKLERPTPEETREKAGDAPALRTPPAAAAPAASRAMKVTAEEESGFGDRDREPERMTLSEQQLEMDAAATQEPPETGAVIGLDKKSRDDGSLTAEDWIERLLQLRASGQEDRLTEELAAFREAYPDHPLPPELLE